MVRRVIKGPGVLKKSDFCWHEITQSLFDDHKEETIAQDLRISAHTVHTYIKRIYQKLIARSRVEVVCIVVITERQMTCRDAVEQNGHGQVAENKPDTNDTP